MPEAEAWRVVEQSDIPQHQYKDIAKNEWRLSLVMRGAPANGRNMKDVWVLSNMRNRHAIS